MAQAQGRGRAKRAMRLEVSGAFHSPLMAPAAAGLAEALAAVTIRDAACPVVANVVGRAGDARRGDIRAALERQLLGAVRWEESMRWLLAAGAGRLRGGGHGQGAARAAARPSTRTRRANVDDPASLEATLAALGAAVAEGGRQ